MRGPRWRIVTSAPARAAMGKLGGDISAADHHDPLRQRGQFEKALIVDQVLFARDG